MGRELTERNEPSIREVKRGTGTTAGAGRTAGTDTSTADTGTGTGAGTGTGTGTTAGAGTTTEKAELLGVPILKDEQAKRDERNAKRRAKYKADKEAGTLPKPKKVSNKKKDEPQAIDKASLNLMIAGVFGVIASRPDCEHWLLTEKEIDSITTPLCNMLKESELFQGMGQYSNQIALVMACATIFLPRLVVSVQKQKERKEQSARIKQIANDSRTDTGAKGTSSNDKNTPAGKSDKRNKGNATATGANNADDVSIFGAPIAY